MQIYRITWTIRSGSIKEYEELFCIANNALEAFLSVHPNESDITIKEAIEFSKKLTDLNTLVVDGEFYDEILDKSGDWIYFDAYVENTNTSDQHEVAGPWEGIFSHKELEKLSKEEIILRLMPKFFVCISTLSARKLAEEALEETQRENMDVNTNN